MIQGIIIENFQSHRKTELTLQKGVNVIIGASDSGKTAILRALRWVCFGKPSGDGMRSHWGGETSVMLQIGENSITRKKGRENMYCANDLEFRAFGNDIPEEILAIVNMDETNMQQQMDVPFLLAETPGNVAAFFNKVAHLDKIDLTMGNIQSEIRSLTKKIENQTENLKKAREKLQSLDFLEKADVLYNILEEKDVIVGTQSSKKSKLENQVNSLLKKRIEIEKALHRIRGEVAVNSILGKYAKIEKIGIEKNKIKSDAIALFRLRQKISKLEGFVSFSTQIETLLGKHAKKSELKNNQSKLNTIIFQLLRTEEKISAYSPIILESIDSLLLKITNLKNKRSYVSKLGDTYKQIGDVIIRAGNTVSMLNTIEIEYAESMPNVCPFCNQKIIHSHE